ncbi:ribosome maturation factor RimM [Mariprofundus ferrooxydans]|uniref:Ribosome maturation factor RimM n=1 Tax=Mariprofundus ferrooxydans PV-1 TaxID=314345 RepID=Q0F050_9PROT|nr:ribosome maturation factor RimM [Mariprofundus ferrooxydans]EAU54834.1 16S rRNA processing protein RimM [Mariprofundus ferrooxydans PV-1]KON46551.1 16S rRNA processing protein RimM [Mariprofundus ferrooxydans]
MTAESLLHIGDILGAHGLKGALIVFSHTRPAQAIAGYSCWWIGKTAATAKAYPVRRCWQHGKRMLAELEGVSDCDQAALFKKLKVWVPIDVVETDDDEYLWEELIGCRVIKEGTLEPLGTVTALEEYGAQDNLLVQTPDDAAEPGEWLIPFIEDVVTDVNLDDCVITVDLPEGMDVCFTPRS